MTLRVLAGSAHPTLAGDVVAGVGCEAVTVQRERFPDGELRLRIGDVRGDDVYLVQPTGPPADDNLMELALLLDACRRAGASRVTAVVPYFGYGRQDRRSRPGEPIGAKVAATVIAAAGADRLVVVDPHAPSFEPLCPIPVDVLSAVPLLTDALADCRDGPYVVVAPDFGAVPLAEQVASALALPVAVVRKTRTSGATVQAEDLSGDVRGRRAIVVDDMITTGATVEAAITLLRDRGAASDPVVAAVHGLFEGPACDRLQRMPLARLVVTDTVPQRGDLPGARACPVAPLLVTAICRLYGDESLDDLELFR